jgi:hypothetical protein
MPLRVFATSKDAKAAGGEKKRRPFGSLSASEAAFAYGQDELHTKEEGRAQPGMAVPQDQYWTASGTGNLACALLSYCDVTSSKILEDQFAISELPSVLSRGLRQHSQKWLCHKDLNFALQMGEVLTACTGPFPVLRASD